MAGVVNTVSLSLGASASVSAPAPAPAPESTASVTASSAAIRNPQVIQDPVAGFITQYVDMNSGQIVSQAPSTIAVAYLRQGLSANGMPKQGAEPMSVTA